MMAVVMAFVKAVVAMVMVIMAASVWTPPAPLEGPDLGPLGKSVMAGPLGPGPGPGAHSREKLARARGTNRAPVTLPDHPDDKGSPEDKCTKATE